MKLHRYIHPCLLTAMLLLIAASAEAEIRAVVIGADQYRELPNLGGAVADARDLSESLGRAGAWVTTLLDRNVTREALLESWQDAVAGAQPDDVLMLAFAGHGIQVPDTNGDELDGLDEAFVLPGFRLGTRDDANLIRDDEIEQIIREVTPRLVLLIADSCHSGTVSRAVDGRADFRSARFVPRSAYDGLEDDLRATQADASTADEIADNAVLFAAVPDHLQVQEVLIDGKARGALSWSVARGVAGAADSNTDGIITLGELASFVPESVRALSESRQTPLVTTRAEMEVQLFAKPEPPPEPVSASSEPPSEPLVAASPAHTPTAIANLRFAVTGPAAREGAATIGRLEGVEIVADPAAADLIWDLPSGDVLTALGDVAARLGPAREPRILQAVVTKWRLLGTLDRHVDATLRARVQPGDGLYRSGQRMSLEIVSERDGRLILFDLAADGSVILILPRPGQAAPELAQGKAFAVPLRAGPPFGADHLMVALAESEIAASRLSGLLRAVHGRPFEEASLKRFLEALQDAVVLPSAVYTAP